MEFLRAIEGKYKVANVRTLKLTPISEYKFPVDDYSNLYRLTCIHHTTAYYLTKHPYFRSIHLIHIPSDENIDRSPTGECLCPHSDLAVVTAEKN